MALSYSPLSAPSSVLSKAFAPVSGPILMVKLNRPLPSMHVVQVPFVENVPVPDGVMPESVMLNKSAWSGTEHTVSAKMGKEIALYTSPPDKLDLLRFNTRQGATVTKIGPTRCSYVVNYTKDLNGR